MTSAKIRSSSHRGTAVSPSFTFKKGVSRLVVTSRQGKEAVIEVLHGGSFFGENALAPNRHRRLNHAIAVTDVRALRIDPDAMLHMLHKDVDVCDAFISSLIELRVRVPENFANNLLYSSEERLARVLSSIAKSHKDAQAWPKVTQQELANMIGVTRQRVNVLLKRFRESGGHSLR